MIEEIRIPLFPLPVVLFPDTYLPLHIFEDRYRKMIRQCIEEESQFGIVALRKSCIVQAGCAAEVTDMLKEYPSGEFDIIVSGTTRFQVKEVFQDKDYLEGLVIPFGDESGQSIFGSEGNNEVLEEILGLYSQLTTQPQYAQEIKNKIASDPSNASFTIANLTGFDLLFKQKLLEERSEDERLKDILRFLRYVVRQANQRGDRTPKFGNN